MTRDTAKKLGLVAAALVLPGGLILGAALVANHRRKKTAEQAADITDAGAEPGVEAAIPGTGETSG